MTDDRSGSFRNEDTPEESDPASGTGDAAQTDRRVERSFTCTACGYATTHEADELQSEVQATCLNCGDWTVQTAAVGDLVDAARSVAERLAGPVLTERQALAYLLRDVVGVGRQETAAAVETTPSNVDNLQRRGREKVADARRILEELEAIDAGTGPSDES